MTSRIYRVMAIVVLGGFLHASAHAGPEMLLYPLARMFGSPPEKELAKCRQALQQLQNQLKSSKVAVLPVYWVHEGHAEWRPEMSQAVVQYSAGRTSAQFEALPTQPGVAHTPLGHNQARYFWERAAAYSAWVRAHPQKSDYVWISEIWSQADTVQAIHVYVIDTQGQIAFTSLMNSHHFGSNLHVNDGAAVERVAKRFFEGMKSDPKTIYPPYGVG